MDTRQTLLQVVLQMKRDMEPLVMLWVIGVWYMDLRRLVDLQCTADLCEL